MVSPAAAIDARYASTWVAPPMHAAHSDVSQTILSSCERRAGPADHPGESANTDRCR
jgi:hypothetical protein